ILARTRSICLSQLLLEPRAGLLVDVHQLPAHSRLPLLFRRSVLHLRHRHAKLLRDQPNGFRKRDVLDLLHKLEHVARRAAPEAMKELPRLVHRERRRLLFMKWTKPRPVLRPRLAQLHAPFAHNADDVGLRAQLFLEVGALEVGGRHPLKYQLRRRERRTMSATAMCTICGKTSLSVKNWTIRGHVEEGVSRRNIYATRLPAAAPRKPTIVTGHVEEGV